MPRQPLLPVYKDADLIFGPAHVERKPEFSAAVGRCIMLWSYVEWQMAMLLAAIMKADTEASIANKQARRTFPAMWFLAVLAALEQDGVALEEI